MNTDWARLYLRQCARWQMYPGKWKTDLASGGLKPLQKKKKKANTWTWTTWAPCSHSLKLGLLLSLSWKSYGATFSDYEETPWASQVALVVKSPPANAGDLRDVGLISGFGRFPRRRKWQLTAVFVPGESHGQLVGDSPYGRTESDMTEAT